MTQEQIISALHGMDGRSAVGLAEVTGLAVKSLRHQLATLVKNEIVVVDRNTVPFRYSLARKG